MHGVSLISSKEDHSKDHHQSSLLATSSQLDLGLVCPIRNGVTVASLMEVGLPTDQGKKAYQLSLSKLRHRPPPGPFLLSFTGTPPSPGARGEGTRRGEGRGGGGCVAIGLERNLPQ